jgi:hypothetical protein
MAFNAKLIGPDQFTVERTFAVAADGIAWLKGRGLEDFEGDVERSELLSDDGELVWWRSNPKTEDQVLAAARATQNAGLYWRGRPGHSPDWFEPKHPMFRRRHQP